MVERINAAEERVKNARQAMTAAQQRVNMLKREANRAERKKRTRMLIQMGAELQSVGLQDASQVARFFSALRPWTFVERETGQKKSILDTALEKARTAEGD